MRQRVLSGGLIPSGRARIKSGVSRPNFAAYNATMTATTFQTNTKSNYLTPQTQSVRPAKVRGDEILIESRD